MVYRFGKNLPVLINNANMIRSLIIECNVLIDISDLNITMKLRIIDTNLTKY